MNDEIKRIPVGYLTKKVTDIRKGDVVRDIGKILSIKNIKDHIFYDKHLGIEYITDVIEFKTKSVLTGRMLYEILPTDSEIEVMMYENI